MRPDILNPACSCFGSLIVYDSVSDGMLRITSRFSSLHQEMQFCLLKDCEAGKLVVVEQVLSWKWG